MGPLVSIFGRAILARAATGMIGGLGRLFFGSASRTAMTGLTAGSLVAPGLLKKAGGAMGDAATGMVERALESLTGMDIPTEYVSGALTLGLGYAGGSMLLGGMTSYGGMIGLGLAALYLANKHGMLPSFNNAAHDTGERPKEAAKIDLLPAPALAPG